LFLRKQKSNLKIRKKKKRILERRKKKKKKVIMNPKIKRMIMVRLNFLRLIQLLLKRQMQHYQVHQNRKVK